MKYEVKGLFENGNEWSEDANNLKELQFVIEKVFSIAPIICNSIRITNRKGDDITKSILRKFYC